MGWLSIINIHVLYYMYIVYTGVVLLSENLESTSLAIVLHFNTNQMTVSPVQG